MNQGEFLLYQTEDAQTRVQLRLQDETVWVTQKQLAELYQKDVLPSTNISRIAMPMANSILIELSGNSG